MVMLFSKNRKNFTSFHRFWNENSIFVFLEQIFKSTWRRFQIEIEKYFHLLFTNEMKSSRKKIMVHEKQDTRPHLWLWYLYLFILFTIFYTFFFIFFPISSSGMCTACEPGKLKKPRKGLWLCSLLIIISHCPVTVGKTRKWHRCAHFLYNNTVQHC